MWFIGVEVEQETSAPPPKKILDPPLSCVVRYIHFYTHNSVECESHDDGPFSTKTHPTKSYLIN